MPKHSVQDPTDIDQLSAAQIDERVEETLEHIEAVRALWPGLERLEEAQRKRSVGRSLGVLRPPLGKRFAVLRPRDGKGSALARSFHVLGDQDGGDDPGMNFGDAGLAHWGAARRCSPRTMTTAAEHVAERIEEDTHARD